MTIQNVTTDENGNFSFNFVETDIGSNSINISFAGNSKYNSSTGNKSYNVSKAQTYLEIVDTSNPETFEAGKIISFVGRLAKTNDGVTIPLSSSNPVNVSINQTSITPTYYANGTFRAEYTPASSGTYTFSVTYEGNSNYQNSFISQEYSIGKQTPILTLGNTTYTRKIGNSLNITGTLLDENNNPIVGHTVNLLFGNQNVVQSATTTANGFSITLPATNTSGEVAYRVSTTSTSMYNLVSEFISVTTNKRDSILTINDISDTSYHNTITISGTLTDEDGVTPISGAELVITY